MSFPSLASSRQQIDCNVGLDSRTNQRHAARNVYAQINYMSSTDVCACVSTAHSHAHWRHALHVETVVITEDCFTCCQESDRRGRRKCKERNNVTQKCQVARISVLGDIEHSTQKQRAHSLSIWLWAAEQSSFLACCVIQRPSKRLRRERKKNELCAKVIRLYVLLRLYDTRRSLRSDVSRHRELDK